VRDRRYTCCALEEAAEAEALKQGVAQLAQPPQAQRHSNGTQARAQARHTDTDSQLTALTGHITLSRAILCAAYRRTPAWLVRLYWQALADGLIAWGVRRGPTLCFCPAAPAPQHDFGVHLVSNAAEAAAVCVTRRGGAANPRAYAAVLVLELRCRRRLLNSHSSGGGGPAAPLGRPPW
jgi:hypothetical protein